MNPQQLEFLKLSKEFYEQKEDQAKSTLEMYLKYCPDALNHLFDTSIMKPCLGQVSLRVIFWLKLFQYEMFFKKNSCLFLGSRNSLLRFFPFHASNK